MLLAVEWPDVVENALGNSGTDLESFLNRNCELFLIPQLNFGRSKRSGIAGLETAEVSVESREGKLHELQSELETRRF
ncbi:hypothetical protein AVEN_1744-1, partial [Araneus ventricosus]